MTEKIFRSILSVSMTALLLCVILVIGILYSHFNNQLAEEMYNELTFISSGIEISGEEYLAGISSEKQIIWLAPDGTVRYGSQNGEDLLQNAEIRDAFDTGFGQKEYPVSFTQRSFACAKRLSDGSVIRLSSVQYPAWILALSILQPLVIVVAVLFALSLGLALALSKKIMRPILEIDPENPRIEEEYRELSPLLHRILRQNQLIQRQMTDLKRKQEEFRAITENMAEGFIVAGKSGEILLYNSSALLMLGTESTAPGNSILTLSQNPVFNHAAQEAMQGRHCQEEFEENGCVYQLFANPVTVDKALSGAVIMLLDITEREQRESMRREFTSNVSHELKTPLTSIYGISEIMANGLVRGEDIPRFAKSIYDETGRLITLVNDIIKLSQMDENSIMAQKEPVDLLAVAQQVCSRLQGVAAENHIALSAEGEALVISGIPGIIEEMIYNLADNGIKYNKENGWVKIKIKQKNGRPYITVSDNGIGISPQHIDRIFERFYRVDKSHSKQVGGTGLGLSIVKHGANFHGASLSVQSTPGRGTAITITFPEQKEAES